MGGNPAPLPWSRDKTAKAAGAGPTVWLIPETIARRPRWLEVLLRVLHRVETAAIFPRLDRGGGTPTPAHQALLLEVIAGLKDPSVSVSGLF